jgi:hypothetical protein
MGDMHEQSGCAALFRVFGRRHFLVIALWLAGCVRTILTPASQPAAPLPGPGHVLVYDFLATLDET